MLLPCLRLSGLCASLLWVWGQSDGSLYDRIGESLCPVHPGHDRSQSFVCCPIPAGCHQILWCCRLRCRGRGSGLTGTTSAVPLTLLPLRVLVHLPLRDRCVQFSSILVCWAEASMILVNLELSSPRPHLSPWQVSLRLKRLWIRWKYPVSWCLRQQHQ